MNREDLDKQNRALLSKKLNAYFRDHRQDLKDIANSVSHLFEAFCYVLVVQHYQSCGYAVKPKNLLKEKFRFRFSTNGNPWNYSYFEVIDDKSGEDAKISVCEIWHNQLVEGAWSISHAIGQKPPLFAADVAIINPNSLPTTAPPKTRRRKGEPVLEKPRRWVSNNDLITFAEAKNLKAYPMLLAQFFGIVHEIKPKFLCPDGATSNPIHPRPILFTNEHLSDGTISVIESLAGRGVLICVVPEVCTSEDWVLLELIRGGLEKLLGAQYFNGAGAMEVETEVTESVDVRF